MKNFGDSFLLWVLVFVGFITGVLIGPIIASTLVYFYLYVFQPNILKDAQWGLLLLPTALVGAVLGGILGGRIGWKTSQKN